MFKWKAKLVAKRERIDDATFAHTAAPTEGLSPLDDSDLDIVRGGMVLMNPTNNANAAAYGHSRQRPNGPHRS